MNNPSNNVKVEACNPVSTPLMDHHLAELAEHIDQLDLVIHSLSHIERRTCNTMAPAFPGELDAETAKDALPSSNYMTRFAKLNTDLDSRINELKSLIETLNQYL